MYLINNRQILRYIIDDYPDYAVLHVNPSSPFFEVNGWVFMDETFGRLGSFGGSRRRLEIQDNTVS